jgi:hypothetical protein
LVLLLLLMVVVLLLQQQQRGLGKMHQRQTALQLPLHSSDATAAA